jgi:hypothetical protein
MNTRNNRFMACAEDRYESPEVVLVEISAEGVLCVSGQNDDEYEQEDFPWD